MKHPTATLRALDGADAPVGQRQETVEELESRLHRLLSREVAHVLAASIMRRARTAAEAAGDPTRLVEEVRTGVRLFVEPHKQAHLFAEIEQLLGPPVSFAPERIVIAGLADVSRARLRAREIARQLGSGAFAVQRASTAVSELARNIVMYATKGHLDLAGRRGTPLVMQVRAVDQGPGIPDVDAVLSGDFRSKTGLGKGLLAVKRVSIRFSLQSGKGGTTVEADIPL